MDTALLSKIKAMLQLGLLEEACESSITLLQGHPLEDQARLISGRFHNLKQEKIVGGLETDETRDAQNEIQKDLQDLLKESVKISKVLDSSAAAPDKPFSNDSMVEGAIRWLCLGIFVAAVFATGYTLFFSTGEFKLKLLQCGGSMAFGAGSVFAYLRLRVLQIAAWHLTAGKPFQDIEQPIKMFP